MAKYQQYNEYKDSGVEWLGEIPSHWVVQPLKHQLIFMKNGSTSTQIDETKETAPISRIETISSGEIDMSRVGFIDIKTIPKTFELDKGDILFSHINSLSMIGNLAIKRNNDKLFHGMNLLRLKLDSSKCVVDYMFWLLKSKNLRQVIEANAKPAINQASISTQSLKNIYLNIPTEKEQTQIANFLDYETAQIDTLIDKQQTLIQLLKEKRQAVISHAVTKGLNPDAPMKDSGVKWVETIPKHWKAYKLGYCAKVGNGATPSRDNPNFWKDGSIGWLNSSKINDVIIHEAEQFITPLAKLKTSVHPVQKNDILMAITGEGQTRGRVAICKLDATINQHLACIRITDKELGYEYLYYWLNSNYDRIRFESSGAGSTKGAITCENITSYPVLIPTKKEQQEIVEYLKEKNEVFDKLMDSAEQAIQLMQERRTALISAAVTGKIDVRGWQAPE